MFLHYVLTGGNIFDTPMVTVRRTGTWPNSTISMQTPAEAPGNLDDVKKEAEIVGERSGRSPMLLVPEGGSFSEQSPAKFLTRIS